MSIRDFFLALGLPVTGYPKPSPEPKGVQRLPVAPWGHWMLLKPKERRCNIIAGVERWYAEVTECRTMGSDVEQHAEAYLRFCDHQWQRENAR